MTYNIDVSTVLRGTVSAYYSNLVTRSTGAAVRIAIENQVVANGSGVVTTIDFSQVTLLDFSCADEIVAKLLLRYGQVGGPSGYLLVRGIHEGHLDPIETVLERHQLALVGWNDDHAELYGCVSDDERWLWEVVRDDGPIGAGDSAEILGITVEQSETVLLQLISRGLIMRVDRGYVVPGARLPLS